jgi:hypothetical protein
MNFNSHISGSIILPIINQKFLPLNSNEFLSKSRRASIYYEFF